MKPFILVLLLSLSFCNSIGYADDMNPGVASGPAVAVLPVPTPIPVGTPPGPAVVVAQPAAPPPWAQDLIVVAEKLPIIGPIVAKALLYVGIVSSILTAIVGCLLTILNALMGVMNLAGLLNVSAALSKFKDGKIMYWLKYFSLFNAKRQELK